MGQRDFSLLLYNHADPVLLWPVDRRGKHFQVKVNIGNGPYSQYIGWDKNNPIEVYECILQKCTLKYVQSNEFRVK